MYSYIIYIYIYICIASQAGGGVVTRGRESRHPTALPGTGARTTSSAGK